MEISSVVTADDTGAIQASIVIREITGRRQAEEAQRQGEELLEAFFAASPGILNIEDEEFRYVRTDAVTPTYFGLDREGLVGKSLVDLAPEFVRTYGPMMRRVMDTGRPEVNLEVQGVVPATGETLHWRASFFPVPLPQGKRGIGVVGVDITDLKRAERNLRESEEKSRRSEEQLRLLFETMQQGVVFLDADGRVLSMNPAAERILDVTAADVKGRQAALHGTEDHTRGRIAVSIGRTTMGARPGHRTRGAQRGEGRIPSAAAGISLDGDECGAAVPARRIETAPGLQLFRRHHGTEAGGGGVARERRPTAPGGGIHGARHV